MFHAVNRHVAIAGTGQDPQLGILAAMFTDVPWADITDMFGIAQAREMMRDTHDESGVLRRRKA